MKKALGCRATGENRTKSGWIERVATRKAQEDIVTAVLLNKAMLGKEKTMTHAELEKIVATLPFPNNYFAVKMLQKYPAVDNNPNPTDKPSAPNNADSTDPNQDQTGE